MECSNGAKMYEMDVETAKVMTAEAVTEDISQNTAGIAPKGTKNNMNKTVLGSVAMKIFIFFLLVISFAVTAISSVLVMYMVSYGAYDGSEYEFIRQAMSKQIWENYYYITNMDLDLNDMKRIEYMEGGEDIKVRLVRLEDDEEIWSNYDGFATPYIYKIYLTYSQDKKNWGYGVFKKENYFGTSVESQQYVWEFYVNPDFPDASVYRKLMQTATILYDSRFYVIGIMAGAGLIFIFFFILLMCGAGHHNGREGISPSLLNFLPIDLYAVVWSIVAVLGIYIGSNYCNDLWSAGAAVTVFGIIELIWGTAFAMELMTRLKLGEFWKNTVIYKFIKLLGRIFRFVFSGLLTAMSGIPQIVDNLIFFFGICILEFIGILSLCEIEVFVLWMLEKIILLPLVIYFSLCQAKLKEAGEALAKGNLNYKLDTSKMILGQKEHGEDLNSIAQGINTAVEERMKSERLKTELITNVSHDIKTPLTSIINYSDLIINESTDNARISEYAEVLNRQSMRLKKLLDDLLEASKATTGNLEVNLQPCEVGVMLTQTIGEYEHRFEEKGLKLVIKQPETSVKVLADSRHMWRIFDNLMNNICKYAMEDSRVYLTVESRDDMANIVFRNMSKYELDISSDELTERFMRGDSSRHIEGNGLGLSIAASLAELQRGTMKIITDGDLFKVILTFPLLAE